MHEEKVAMFGLRPKLALGFGGLLALLALLGLQSVVWLNRLGDSIDVILRENYRSVVACEEMKEALERMDSGALFGVAGDLAEGRNLVERNAPLFAQALDAELHNVTLPGEGERANRLRDLYAAYRPALGAALDPALGPPARRALYFGRLLPLFQQIKGTADAILQMNQRNMVEANASARRLAVLGKRRMYGLLALGAALAVAFVLLLSRAILLPLSRLTRSAQDIEHGNLDLVVPVESRDELGELAIAFNAMASRLRELRRSGQARLLRAQQTSQLAIDSLPDAVAVFSPEGQIELANRTATATFSLKPGEPVPERHAEWLPRLLADTARGGGVPDSGYEAALQIFQEGKERFFLPHAVAVRDPQGQLLGTTLILSDITNLRRLDEMKSGALSTVSHELRTPLTSLQMALHILLEERVGPLTAAQTDLLVAGRDDAERLRQILVNLLEISRFESGSGQLRLEPVSPRDYVEDAVAGLRSAFDDAGVELSVAIDPEAPKVAVDPVRARLVLSNLLGNALKHTPAGGTVTVAAKPAAPANGSVRFAVSDSGRGIAAEHLPHLFEKFYQVPGSEALGGAGLGLAIAREIVQAHGGEIGAAAEPSPAAASGTTFWFTLPAAS